jgi:hypothetical protein
MQVEARCADDKDVEAMRDLYRREANCQVIHDFFLARALADRGRQHEGRQVGNVEPAGAALKLYSLGRPLFLHALRKSLGL